MNERANDGSRFDRLPATADERIVEGRATRREVLDFWSERYGIAPETFENYSFWEKGAGKIWAFCGEMESPVEIEALGITFLRTRQEHWKPTTDAVQRFGRHAKKNVIELDGGEAWRFVAGEDQQVGWDGDWGYLIAAHTIAGEREPLGIGLFIDGELRSQVPKGRRRELVSEP
jgi:NOL1/NOP2/fmu family ribosome biogenesis protein